MTSPRRRDGAILARTVVFVGIAVLFIAARFSPDLRAELARLFSFWDYR